MTDAHTAAQEILAGADIAEQYQAGMATAAVDHDLGFIVASDLGKVHGDRIMLVGFAVSGWQFGQDWVGDKISPIVDFRHLPAIVHVAARQAKGVGPRLYNTAQALGGTAENPDHIGIYAFQIRPDKICDERKRYDRTIPGMVLRGVQYRCLAGRAGKHHEQLDAVVASVHKRQGKVDAVLLNQTPDAWLKQRRRHLPRSPIPEEFMIIRNPRVVARKIGDYNLHR